MKSKISTEPDQQPIKVPIEDDLLYPSVDKFFNFSTDSYLGSPSMRYWEPNDDNWRSQRQGYNSFSMYPYMQRESHALSSTNLYDLPPISFNEPLFEQMESQKYNHSSTLLQQMTHFQMLINNSIPAQEVNTQTPSSKQPTASCLQPVPIPHHTFPARVLTHQRNNMQAAEQDLIRHQELRSFDSIKKKATTLNKSTISQDRTLLFSTQKNSSFFTKKPTMGSQEKKSLTAAQIELKAKLIRAIQQADLKKFTPKLRDYQEEAIKAIPEYFQKDDMAGYFRIPTGGGKTVIMMAIASFLKKKTLIIVPTTLLVDQTIKNAEKIFNKKAIYRFDSKKKPNLKALQSLKFCVCITTYQTMAADGKQKIKKALKNFPLILVDEYHHSMEKKGCVDTNLWSSLVTQFSNLTIGFTATPKASNDIEQVIYEKSISALISSGYLSPFIYSSIDVPMKKPARISKELNSDCITHNEFEQISHIVCDFLLNGKTPCGKKIISLDNNQESKKILIFCTTIDNAKQLTAYINAQCGNKRMAECITSEEKKRPKEEKIPIKDKKNSKSNKKQIIEDYHQGLFPIMIGCKAFVEGFDLPKIDLLLNITPTASAIMATQRFGRILRIAPEKEYAWAIDVNYSLDHDPMWVSIPSLMENQHVGGPIEFMEKIKNYPCYDEKRTTKKGIQYAIKHPEMLSKKTTAKIQDPAISFFNTRSTYKNNRELAQNLQTDSGQIQSHFSETCCNDPLPNQPTAARKGSTLNL